MANDLIAKDLVWGQRGMLLFPFNLRIWWEGLKREFEFFLPR
jgi:hypothetical protein